MKLPDFTQFKPLEENRERMQAERTDKLQGVTMDALSMSDLEAKQMAEKPVAAEARAQAAPAPGPQQPGAKPVQGPRQMAPGQTKVLVQHRGIGLIKTVLLIQAMLLANGAIAFAILYFKTSYGKSAIDGIPPQIQQYVKDQIVEYWVDHQPKKRKTPVPDTPVPVFPAVPYPATR